MVASKLAPLAEPALGAVEGAALASGAAGLFITSADLLSKNWGPVLATGALLGVLKWGADKLNGPSDDSKPEV